jgi:hypothetical protein
MMSGPPRNPLPLSLLDISTHRRSLQVVPDQDDTVGSVSSFLLILGCSHTSRFLRLALPCLAIRYSFLSRV